MKNEVISRCDLERHAEERFDLNVTCQIYDELGLPNFEYLATPLLIEHLNKLHRTDRDGTIGVGERYTLFYWQPSIIYETRIVGSARDYINPAIVAGSGCEDQTNTSTEAGQDPLSN